MLSTGRSAYRDSIGPRPPCTRSRAMVTTSPRTGLAVGTPPASAVLGDVVTIARRLVHGGRGPIESRYADLPVLSMADAVTRYQVPRDGDDVAEDRTGRRHAAGSLAVEHQRPGRLGLNEHGVERTTHTGERVLVRDQRRVHPDNDPRPALAVRGSALGHREQLDHVAGLGRPGHVLRGDRGDALPVHICRAHPGV